MVYPMLWLVAWEPFATQPASMGAPVFNSILPSGQRGLGAAAGIATTVREGTCIIAQGAYFLVPVTPVVSERGPGGHAAPVRMAWDCGCGCRASIGKRACLLYRRVCMHAGLACNALGWLLSECRCWGAALGGRLSAWMLDVRRVLCAWCSTWQGSACAGAHWAHWALTTGH